LNELNGLQLHCTPSQLSKDGTCPITSGEQTIKSLGLDYITIGGCFGALIAFITVARLIAFCGIRFLKA